MKKIVQLLSVVIGALVVGATAGAQSRNLCTGPFHQPEVCNRMKHLRSAVNVLDGQRELMQINYPYISAIGSNISENVTEILKVITMENPDHVESLRLVKAQADKLQILAGKQSLITYEHSNLIRQTCANCHSKNSPPPSGVNWNEVWNYDWEVVSKNCNTPGRNPYTCKSMNGLFTTYSHIITAFVVGLQNFDTLKADAQEIVRLLQDLGKNGAFHIGEGVRAKAESEAREVITLAELKDAAAFEKSLTLSDSCTTCHTENGRGTFKPMALNFGKKKN